MKCNRCGYNIENKNNFCPNCGNQLGNVSSNNDYLLIGVLLLLFMPLIGIIFCLLTMKSDSRLKKVLLYYFVILVVFIGGLILLAYGLASMFFPSNDPSSREFKCFKFCDGEYSIENYYCVCKDGRSYDMFPEREEINNNDDNNNNNDDSNVDDGNNFNNDDKTYTDDELIKTKFDKTEWLNTVSSSEYVINVIAASWCPHCQNYKPIVIDAAKKKKIKLFFIENDKLSKEDYTAYTTSLQLNKFKGSVPYTFITFNGKVLNERVGGMDLEETIDFINNTKQDLSSF